jgi:hypothetical protein
MAALLPGASPASAQSPAGCTTEVYLYVEKSASASTRNAARDVLSRLYVGTWPNLGEPAGGPTTVRLFSFAGDVSTSTVAQLTIPGPGPETPAEKIDAALEAAVLSSPSTSTTDLLKIFGHIQQTLAPTAAPPLGPVRRFVFVVGDFAHAPLTDTWRTQGETVLAQLRQTAVANQNVHLIAVQSPPPGPIPPGPQREVTAAIAKSFLFFDDSAAGLNEVSELINDTMRSPLELNLSNGTTPTTLLLQVSNPTCIRQQQIVYKALGDGIAARALPLTCPAVLNPGLGGGPCPVETSQLGSLAPATGCVNLWIEAEASDPNTQRVTRRGTAPQPILLGNCLEITEADHDLRRKFPRDPKLREYPIPRACPAGSDECLGTGLRFRGHLTAPAVNITWSEIPSSGGAPVVLGDRRDVPSANLNGNAFDGALRRVSDSFGLSESVARRVCLEGRQDEPTRLRVAINWGGTSEATTDLIRVYPGKGSLFSHNAWESSLLPFLLLLVLGIVAANHLMPAEVGKLANVLVALAIGFLALGFAAHYASALGNLFEESFALRLEWISTAGVLAIGFCYLILLLMGYFDQRPTAKECLDQVREQPFEARKSRRSRRTVAGLSLIAVPILLTLGAIWLLPRKLEECRFSYTSVQAP